MIGKKTGAATNATSVEGSTPHDVVDIVAEGIHAQEVSDGSQMNSTGNISTLDDNQMSVDEEEVLPTLTSGFTIFQNACEVTTCSTTLQKNIPFGTICLNRKEQQLHA